MKLQQFADQLDSIKTNRDAQILLNQYLVAFNFQNYAFTLYCGHKAGKILYDCASESLRSWHSHYLEQGYADIDRTLEEVNLGVLPLFWDVQKQLAHAKNVREERIRLESIEFGIDKGLSVPVYGPNSDFASLTLHQFRHETCLKNYKLYQYEWLCAAKIFYHTIKRILNTNEIYDLHNSLTKREKQCLLLTAQAKRVEQIAKELKISSSTVNFHLQNANKKLGTKNKYQAISKYLEHSKRG